MEMSSSKSAHGKAAKSAFRQGIRVPSTVLWEASREELPPQPRIAGTLQFGVEWGEQSM